MLRLIDDWVGLRPFIVPSDDDLPKQRFFVNVYSGDHCEIAYGCFIAFSRGASRNFAGWGKNKPLYRISVKPAA